MVGGNTGSSGRTTAALGSGCKITKRGALQKVKINVSREREEKRMVGMGLVVKVDFQGDWKRTGKEIARISSGAILRVL